MKTPPHCRTRVNVQKRLAALRGRKEKPQQEEGTPTKSQARTPSRGRQLSRSPPRDRKPPAATAPFTVGDTEETTSPLLFKEELAQFFWSDKQGNSTFPFFTEKDCLNAYEKQRTDFEYEPIIVKHAAIFPEQAFWFKQAALYLISIEIRKMVKLNCEGCVIDSPSQLDHDSHSSLGQWQHHVDNYYDEALVKVTNRDLIKIINKALIYIGEKRRVTYIEAVQISILNYLTSGDLYDVEDCINFPYQRLFSTVMMK